MIINTDFIYPIGSIYISTSSVNPSNLFGGTWEAFSTGRFLLGAGAPAANTASDFGDLNNGGYVFHTLDMGGAYKHQLQTSEMPSHTHKLNRPSSDIAASGNAIGSEFVVDKSTGTATSRQTTATGGGLTHNNMPPYCVVYIWRRIA